MAPEELVSIGSDLESVVLESRREVARRAARVHEWEQNRSTSIAPCMTAKIIDGKAIAQKLRAEYHARVDTLANTARHHAGADGHSRRRQSRLALLRAQQDRGLQGSRYSFRAHRAADGGRPEAELLAHIDRLNDDPTHARHSRAVAAAGAHPGVASVLGARISVEKDVDGFHLYNMGGLVTGNTVFSPCTPYGVQKILEHENIPVEGRNVVVVGASNIVGKPDGAHAHAARRDGGHLPQEDSRPRSISRCSPTFSSSPRACRT